MWRAVGSKGRKFRSFYFAKIRTEESQKPLCCCVRRLEGLQSRCREMTAGRRWHQCSRANSSSLLDPLTPESHTQKPRACAAGLSLSLSLDRECNSGSTRRECAAFHSVHRIPVPRHSLTHSSLSLSPSTFIAFARIASPALLLHSLSPSLSPFNESRQARDDEEGQLQRAKSV